jgi:hypothetical protein
VHEEINFWLLYKTKHTKTPLYKTTLSTTFY